MSDRDYFRSLVEQIHADTHAALEATVAVPPTATEVCAAEQCESPLDPGAWHQTSDGGGHTRRPLSVVLDRLNRLELVFSAVYNLDRCVHGRHERDTCFGCQVRFPPTGCPPSLRIPGR